MEGDGFSFIDSGLVVTFARLAHRNGRLSVKGASSRGRMPNLAFLELCLVELGDLLPNALTEIEVEALDRRVLLGEPPRRLNHDMEAAVDVPHEFDCHPLEPAGLVRYLGPQDVEWDIDFLDRIFEGAIDSLEAEKELPYGLSVLVEPLRLEEVHDRLVHVEIPVGESTLETCRTVSTLHSQL